jgi:hypothetical protein
MSPTSSPSSADPPDEFDPELEERAMEEFDWNSYYYTIDHEGDGYLEWWLSVHDRSEPMASAREAKNVMAIRAWLEQHRPDNLPGLDMIVRGLDRRDHQSEMVFASMAMAFEAGRAYQRANPDDDSP